MSPLQATTTSDAEFAIENNVSTRASSCLKEREPGAGEAGSAGLEGREASAFDEPKLFKAKAYPDMHVFQALRVYFVSLKLDTCTHGKRQYPS